MAGFQLAGPTLSPATFRDALFNLPPTGGVYCGCVTIQGMSYGRHLASYPGEKYVNTDDIAEKWWDPRATAPDELGTTGPGAWQFVNGGKRIMIGSSPTGEPKMFDPAGAVTGYFNGLPPSDRPPDYPPPDPPGS
jgi:hypothetical protein